MRQRPWAGGVDPGGQRVRAHVTAAATVTAAAAIAATPSTDPARVRMQITSAATTTQATNATRVRSRAIADNRTTCSTASVAPM